MLLKRVGDGIATVLPAILLPKCLPQLSADLARLNYGRALAGQKIGPSFLEGPLRKLAKVVLYFCGGLLVVPVGLELPGDVPLLLLELHVSEIMSTLVTLKVFSAEPLEAGEVPAAALLSQAPFTETSCPTWAETS